MPFFFQYLCLADCNSPRQVYGEVVDYYVVTTALGPAGIVLLLDLARPDLPERRT
jgi:hypothetical protein